MYTGFEIGLVNETSFIVFGIEEEDYYSSDNYYKSFPETLVYDIKECSNQTIVLNSFTGELIAFNNNGEDKLCLKRIAN